MDGPLGVVMLGGWAAFVVVPVLGLWVAGATALYALTRRRAARRVARTRDACPDPPGGAKVGA